MNNAIGIIFYVILAIVGFICIWNGFEMKTKGELKMGWFVGQNISSKKCRDVPGFINCIYVPIMIFGGGIVIGAAAMILLEAFKGSKFIQLGLLILVVILYLWFNGRVKKATEKYLL